MITKMVPMMMTVNSDDGRKSKNSIIYKFIDGGSTGNHCQPTIIILSFSTADAVW